MKLNVEALRSEFAFLRSGEPPLAYLDTAASAQKPDAVVSAVKELYETSYANVHRGSYDLSVRATAAYEASRQVVADSLGAQSADEVVFTSGTTGAINLVASSWGAGLQPGDEIIVSEIEHHSNIVPWQLLAARTGAVLRAAPVLDDGAFDLSSFEKMLSANTKMVSVVHVSNALGTVMPVTEIAEMAHGVGARVLVDGAQAMGHGGANVAALGCDFYAFSGHKAYGPTGIGALWASAETLRSLPPYQGGGEMIESVSFDGSTWAEPPARFEAGTPNIAGAVGMAAALRWIERTGRALLVEHEAGLLEHGTAALARVPGLRIIGTAPQKGGVLSFVIEGTHPHDVAMLLDEQGVAVRAGHHCAEPAMRRFGVVGTVRASIGAYNTVGDLDRLAEGLELAKRMLA